MTALVVLIVLLAAALGHSRWVLSQYRRHTDVAPAELVTLEIPNSDDPESPYKVFGRTNPDGSIALLSRVSISAEP